MHKKRCPKCNKVSYSLSRKGFWFCPGCGSDLLHVPFMRRDAMTADLLPIKGLQSTSECRN